MAGVILLQSEFLHNLSITPGRVLPVLLGNGRGKRGERGGGAGEDSSRMSISLAFA